MEIAPWMSTQMRDVDGPCVVAADTGMEPYSHEAYVEELTCHAIAVAQSAGFQVEDLNELRADIGHLVYQCSQWTQLSTTTPKCVSIQSKASKSHACTAKTSSYVAQTRGPPSRTSGKSA